MVFKYPPPPGSKPGSMPVSAPVSTSVSAPASAPVKKKRSPILLIIILIFGFLSIGCVASITILPGLLLRSLDFVDLPSDPPVSFPPPSVPPPIRPQPVSPPGVEQPGTPQTTVPSPVAPTTPRPVAPAPKPYVPSKPVPYTVEPLEIAVGTTLADAERQFVEHYGEHRVVRVTLKTTDGPPPPQTADWLRRVLPKYVPAGLEPSVFVVAGPESVTGIVAPLRQLGAADDSYFWGDKSQLDHPRRTVTAELTAALIPPAADSEDEAAAIEKLTPGLAADRFSPERKTAAKELVRMYSPAATDALVAAAVIPFSGRSFGGGEFFEELEKLRPLPAGGLIDWYRKNPKLPFATSVFNLVRVSGDDFTAVELETLLSQLADPAGKDASAKLALEDAIADLRYRDVGTRRAEEAARAEDEADPPQPQSPDVKFAAKTRDFSLEFLWNRAAAAKKYQGQWVELTGPLQSVGYNHEGKAMLHLESENDWMMCVAKDPFPWKEVTPGQIVVLKGRVNAEFVLALEDCEILSATGPKAIRPTPAQLGARYLDVRKGEEAFHKDRDRWVRTTGVICEIETGGRYFLLETGVDCKVRVNFFSLPKEKAKFQVGQTLSVLGRLHYFSHPPFHRIELDDCVLCEPPSGPQPAAAPEPPQKSPASIETPQPAPVAAPEAPRPTLPGSRQHFAGYTAPAFSHDGRWFLVADPEGDMHLLELGSLRETRRFKGHTGPVASAAFSPDGSEIYSTGKDKTARVWNTSTGDVKRSFALQVSPEIAYLSVDLKRWCLVAGHSHAYVYDVVAGRPLKDFEFRAGADEVWIKDVTADGGYALVAGMLDDVRVHNLTTGEAVQMKTHAYVYAASLSSNGRMIITSGRDPTVRLWNRADGKLLKEYRGLEGDVYVNMLTPDQRRIFASGKNGRCVIWDVQSVKPLQSFDCPDVALISRFSGDGKHAWCIGKQGIMLLATPE